MGFGWIQVVLEKLKDSKQTENSYLYRSRQFYLAENTKARGPSTHELVHSLFASP